MDISIFGMGYVGVISAVCLASRGHSVIGVDVNPEKVKLMNEGKSPIIEEGLDELLESTKKANLLSATCDTDEAIKNSSLSIICVGTPSRSNGSLDTKYLERVSTQIGESLKNKTIPHILVYRSTMLPGTTRDIIVPIIEKHSEGKEGKDFFVAFNPEFLRESSAIYDFNNPPKTVVGSNSEATSQVVLDLYEGLPGPKISTKLEIAEMVKYVDNNFHALKITFANEIGAICKKFGMDSHEVMNIFVQDKKLNISPYYLRPGFAFGGSCLPKDLRAINNVAKLMDLDTPLLNSLLTSNAQQIEYATKKIMSFGKKKIGIAGFTFKSGTDDLRESPIIDVIETLIGKGYELKLYDRNISLARLIGANKEYINTHIKHISDLLVDSLEELISDCEVIVIGNNSREFEKIIDTCSDDQIIFDMVRIKNANTAKDNYEGITWSINQKFSRPVVNYNATFKILFKENYKIYGDSKIN